MCEEQQAVVFNPNPAFPVRAPEARYYRCMLDSESTTAAQLLTRQGCLPGTRSSIVSPKKYGSPTMIPSQTHTRKHTPVCSEHSHELRVQQTRCCPLLAVRHWLGLGLAGRAFANDQARCVHAVSSSSPPGSAKCGAARSSYGSSPQPMRDANLILCAQSLGLTLYQNRPGPERWYVYATPAVAPSASACRRTNTSGRHRKVLGPGKDRALVSQGASTSIAWAFVEKTLPEVGGPYFQSIVKHISGVEPQSPVLAVSILILNPLSEECSTSG